MALSVKRLEGKYEILDKLGEGGMGAVYKVRHLLLDELRVIKVMRTSLKGDPELEARFKREARVASQLRHPHIAQLYDFTIDEDGTAYIVLEFIEGMTLEELLGRFGPPPLGLALEVARQSLKAIGYLHQKNFVHRDISPDNLMLSRDVDGKPQIKLIDLGIAKVLEGGGPGLTVTGMFLGKVRYTSPEQLDGSLDNLDGRSDLYSFGVVLYELLTGRSPIEGSSPPSVIAGHLFRSPLDFDASDPQGRLPPELREIVMQALEKKRDDRISSARAFSQRLGKLQGQFPSSAPEVQDAFGKIVASFGQRRSQREVGSTQERLNEQFSPETTPTRRKPSESGPGAPRSTRVRGAEPTEPLGEPRTPASVTREPEQIAMLLSGARKLAELGQHEPARQQLEALRSIDPENPQLRELLAEIEAELRDRQRQETAQEIDAMLEKGELEEAEVRLQAAVAELGEDGVLAEIRQRLDELQRLAELDRLQNEARRLAGEEDYRGAVNALERAAKLVPDHKRVEESLAEYRQALERQEKERRRQAAISDVETHLQGGELSRAEQALRAAVSEQGEDEELRALAERIAAARAQELERRRAAAADEVEARLTAGELEEAEDLLVAAVSELGTHETLTALEQRLRDARELADAAASVEAALGEGLWNEAGDLLAKARRKFGGVPVLEELEARLETLRRENLERTTKKRLEAARAKLATDDYQGALADLRLAAELSPEHPEVVELGAEAKAALERERERRRRAQALEQTGREVESLLERGRLDKAARVLAKAERQWGEAPELEALRRRLEEAETRQKLEALLTRAREHLDGERFEAALEALEETEGLDVESSGVAGLRSEIEEARRLHQAEQRREKLDAESEAIEQALSAQDLDGASQRLDAAVEGLGETAGFKDLRARIERARREIDETRVLDREIDETVRIEPGEATTAIPLADQVTIATPLEDMKPGAAEPTVVSRHGATAAVRPDATVVLADAPEVKAAPEPAAEPVSRPGPRVDVRKYAVPIAAVLVLVVVGFIAARLFRPEPRTPPPPPPESTTVESVVLRAVPWGLVTSIRDGDGNSVNVPEEAYTPLVLALPPGEYEIDLSYGEGAGSQTVKIKIGSGAEKDPDPVKLSEVSVDEFFESVGY